MARYIPGFVSTSIKSRPWSPRVVSWLASISVVATLATPSSAASWTLVGWNNLGMHCMDGDYAIFSLLPPYNTIHAQLIDTQGHLVTNPTGISVTYEAVADPDGSINRTSAGKSNFWDFVQPLFGAALPEDTGLTGVKMPGVSNTARPMTYDPASQWFIAEGIPITPYDDDGNKNFYPMMRLVARDPQGMILASTDIVLPVSDEMSCKSCHASGSASGAMPPSGWANNPDPERDVRLNILKRHDDTRRGTPQFSAALAAVGYNPDGLVATVTQDRKSILCASCHLSEALPGSGQPGVPPLTQSIHGHHSMLDQGESGRTACYKCHPGSATRCLRGAMGGAVAADGTLAMQCQSCHGSMVDVASPNRTGWLNEPSCQQCHTGTAVQNNGQIRFSSVFDATGRPRVAVNNRFATTDGAPAAGLSLYRFSTGHGGLKCEACHGSTHAEFPSLHRNDNLQSIARQGHVGMLVECTSCHASQPQTVNGGPHGMHPVGQTWISRHPGVVESSGSAACRDCHGQDYRGTVLSRAQADRLLNTEFGGKYFWRGFQVGCYNCHRGPSNDSANSNRPAVVVSQTVATSMSQSLAITLTGSDPDGNSLQLRVVSQSDHGTVALSGTRATYFPDADFIGDDVFTFAAWDGSTDSNLGSVTIHVAAAPAATPTHVRATPTPSAVAATPTPFAMAGCASGISIEGAQLSMRADSYAVAFKGQAVVPKPWQGVDPLANGVTLRIESGVDGSTREVTLPGGAVADGVGWRVNGAGTRWMYLDRSGRNGPIRRANIRDLSSRRPGLVGWSIQGGGGTSVLPSPTGLRAAIVVGAPAECAVVDFNDPGQPSPSCTGDAARIRCR